MKRTGILSLTVLLLVFLPVFNRSFNETHQLTSKARTNSSSGRGGKAAQKYPGWHLVFGDSKDWYIWSAWCEDNDHNVVRLCDVYPLVFRCPPSVHVHMMCFDSSNRPLVVFFLHYGVALTSPYYHRYASSHRLPDIPASTSTRLPLLLAFCRNLFQSVERFVVFASNSWDAERLVELGKEWSTREWVVNATYILETLKTFGVKNIILETSHFVESWRHPMLVAQGNEAMIKLSLSEHISILDTNECLGNKSDVLLKDGLHPNRATSLQIASCMLSHAQSQML